jgi:hypothetical protein
MLRLARCMYNERFLGSALAARGSGARPRVARTPLHENHVATREREPRPHRPADPAPAEARAPRRALGPIAYRRDAPPQRVLREARGLCVASFPGPFLRLCVDIAVWLPQCGPNSHRMRLSNTDNPLKSPQRAHTFACTGDLRHVGAQSKCDGLLLGAKPFGASHHVPVPLCTRRPVKWRSTCLERDEGQNERRPHPDGAIDQTKSPTSGSTIDGVPQAQPCVLQSQAQLGRSCFSSVPCG